MLHARSLATRFFKKQSAELLSFNFPLGSGRSASSIVSWAAIRGYATQIKFPNRKGLKIIENKAPFKIDPDKNQGSLINYKFPELKSINAFRSETSALVNDSNGRKLNPCLTPVTYRYTGVSVGDKKLLEAVHYEIFYGRTDLRFILYAPKQEIFEGDTFDVYGVKQGKRTNRFDIVMKKKMEETEEDDVDGEVKYETFEYSVVWEVKEAVKKTSIEKEGQEKTEEAYFKEKAMVAFRHESDGDYAVSIPDDQVDWMKTLMNYRINIEIDGRQTGLEDFPVNLTFFRVSHSFQPASSQIPDKYLEELPVIPAGAVAIKVERLTGKRRQEVMDRLRDCSLPNYKEMSFGLLNQLYDTANRNGMIADKEFDGRVDANVLLRTLDDVAQLPPSPLLGVIYEKNRQEPAHKVENAGEETVVVRLKNGDETSLNLQQSHAVRLFEDGSVPALIVQSPPGSGKTTVAAAMAVRVGGPTLLTSMQNVAVDAVGAAIKKTDDNGTVYNMKSIGKLDPYRPAPFDFFDLHEDQLQEWKDRKEESVKAEEDWKRKKEKLRMTMKRDGVTEKVKKLEKEVKELEGKMKSYEKDLSEAKKGFEQEILKNSQAVLLMTVQMTLTLMNRPGYWRDTLGRMERVIIDETSMMPEAALFCLLGRIPDAKYVFIGDDKQLPPFKFDPKVLGHQLANRSAISVVTKHGRIPVIELNETYRAPQDIIDPYSKEFYDGKLVSKKVREDWPLSDAGLVPNGSPQLLFVNVDGTEMKNEETGSFSNDEEFEALNRLFSILIPEFPNASDRAKKEIMVICLYSAQVEKVREKLGPGWAVHTVDSSQFNLSLNSGLIVPWHTECRSFYGQEASIVFVLTTRTSTRAEKSFFNSPNRCNVAVSRARLATVILGHRETLERCWKRRIREDERCWTETKYWKIILHIDSDKLRIDQK